MQNTAIPYLFKTIWKIQTRYVINESNYWDGAASLTAKQFMRVLWKVISKSMSIWNFNKKLKKNKKIKRKWKKAIHNRETTPRQEWNAEAEWRSWSDVWVAFLDWGWGRSLLKSCNFLRNVSLKFVFKKRKITTTANLQGTNVVHLNLKTDNKCYRIIMKKNCNKWSMLLLINKRNAMPDY